MDRKISIIGLGYVGLPVAVAFGDKSDVISQETLKSSRLILTSKYESTVYPGATEEDYVPVLEKYSRLNCEKDFFVGYLSERINSGGKEHTFTKIRKIVSGQASEVLEIVADVYSSVVTAGVYKVASIKVVDADKVVENACRIF